MVWLWSLAQAIVVRLLHVCVGIPIAICYSLRVTQAHPRMIQYLSSIYSGAENVCCWVISSWGKCPKSLKGLYDWEIKATVTVILPSHTAGFRWMLYSRHYTLPSSPAYALWLHTQHVPETHAPPHPWTGHLNWTVCVYILASMYTCTPWNSIIVGKLIQVSCRSSLLRVVMT